MARLLAQDPYAEDVILRAMKDELERSRQLRVVGGSGDDTPYFISYTLDDNDAFEVDASFGAVTTTSRNRFRLPNIEVRVGSYDFDNTGHIYSGLYSGSRYDTEPLPLDNDYRTLREGLWLGTDYAYKAAVESIARKRAALTNAAAPADKLPDYTRADKFESLAKITRTKVDEAAWAARMAKHSAIFNAYPEVLASGVEFHFNQDTTYYLDTEGTALRYPDDAAWIYARAEGQSPDGMVLRDTLATPALRSPHFLRNRKPTHRSRLWLATLRLWRKRRREKPMWDRYCSNHRRRRSFWRSCSATICIFRANRFPIPTGP